MVRICDKLISVHCIAGTCTGARLVKSRVYSRLDWMDQTACVLLMSG